MIKIILLNVLLLINVNLFAQSFSYRNFKYEWPAERPVPIAVNDSFKNEDAVILDEKCFYNEGGVVVPGYYFLNFKANYFFVDESTQGINPVVQKHIRIKYQTKKGIEKFSKFILPESFDPQFDEYNVPPQDRDSANRPLGIFKCIRHFAARVIKANGTIVNAELKERTTSLVLSGDRGDINYYNWIFDIVNLAIGDELEVDYCYEGSFNFGNSNRIFFNGDMPKQSLDFTFRYPEIETYIFTYHNGASPKDSIKTTKTSPKSTEYYFHFTNLAGGVHEPGGRPYMQFPYLSFYRHQRDFGIENPKTKFVDTPLPYPWAYVMLPYAGYKYEDLKLRLSRMDNSTQELNVFTNYLIKNASDTSAASVISYLQHHLAEDFDYKEDEGFYSQKVPMLEKLGANIESKILRQMSRMRIYDEVLTRLDKPFFHSLICDKRIGTFDVSRFESLTATRFGVAVPYKDYIINFYPKSYRYGYESNELPFYYEDTYSLLIPQHEESVKKYELVPQVKFLFSKTPFSNLKDNSRNTSCLIKVALDSMLVKFNAKINLSGQFSTLTRGYYKYGCKDTTVNPEYYNIISARADDTSKVKKNIGKTNQSYPFDILITQEFIANKMLKKSGQNDFTFDLKGLFNNITERGFASNNRHLDYYPDFQSIDNHRYILHFDHKIRLNNLDDFNRKIENNFANYEFKISQPSETDVLIESSFITKAYSIAANETQSVETVFNAILSLNDAFLKISILP